jgi:hypothetical protein
MKYNVSIENCGMSISGYENLSKKEAQRVAKIEAEKPENEDNQVFVKWFRKSDGQKGYLNNNGNHEITGSAW